MHLQCCEGPRNLRLSSSRGAFICSTRSTAQPSIPEGDALQAERFNWNAISCKSCFAKAQSALRLLMAGMCMPAICTCMMRSCLAKPFFATRLPQGKLFMAAHVVETQSRSHICYRWLQGVWADWASESELMGMLLNALGPSYDTSIIDWQTWDVTNQVPSTLHASAPLLLPPPADAAQSLSAACARTCSYTHTSGPIMLD